MDASDLWEKAKRTPDTRTSKTQVVTAVEREDAKEIEAWRLAKQREEQDRMIAEIEQRAIEKYKADNTQPKLKSRTNISIFLMLASSVTGFMTSTMGAPAEVGSPDVISWIAEGMAFVFGAAAFHFRNIATKFNK